MDPITRVEIIQIADGSFAAYVPSRRIHAQLPYEDAPMRRLPNGDVIATDAYNIDHKLYWFPLTEASEIRCIGGSKEIPASDN